MLNLEKNICIADIDLWLDPTVKKPFAFVSHGHSDHIRRHERVLLSPETALFYNDRYKTKSDILARPFNEPFSLNGCTLELFPSGHMLGSAQILIEGKKRVVYTGDFKLEPGGTSRPADKKM